MRFLRRNSDDAVKTAVADGSGADGSGGASESTGTSTGTSTETTAETTNNTRGRGYTPGKGRPTPKRRDAEGRRRGPAPPPPKTQREAIKLARQNRASRAERRKEAAERRRRMLAGDERALLPRDRGPVKAFVRDFVDSRPHLSGLFMPLAGLVFLSLIFQSMPIVQSYISLFCMAMLMAMALEGVLLGRQVTRLARERFPKEQINGLALGWYAFSRASQIRKLRVPQPRVKRGDPIR